MNRFLVGVLENLGEYPDELLIVNALDRESAIEKYKSFALPTSNFIEYLFDGFSENFWYDEESLGQKKLSRKEIKSRIYEYFKEKPEYFNIYWGHWNAPLEIFPKDMIFWIWRKELNGDEGRDLQAFNLDEITEHR